MKFNKNIFINLIGYGLIFGLTFLMLFLLWKLGEVQKAKYRNLEVFYLPKAKPIWERKVESGEVTKIGIMTDNHIRPTRINKNDERVNAPRFIKSEYLETFINFNRQMSSFGPDFIVHLGDSIEGTDDPDYVGLSGIKLVEKELLKNKVPVYWVLGNHELRSITKNQFREALKIEDLDYIIDRGDYRFVFLDGNYDPENAAGDFAGDSYIPGFLHPRTLAWLEEQLKTDKRVFVFMHQSVLSQEYLNNNQIAKNPVLNGREMMDLFEKYNVEAFFNGHIESRYYEEVEGVKYYSLPGTKKSPDYIGSYYELMIKNNQSDLTMFYRDSMTGRKKVINFKTGENI